MTELKTSGAFVRTLSDAVITRPTRVSYLRTFDQGLLLRTAIDLGGIVDNAPILAEAPVQVGRTYAAGDGTAWFVPAASVPRRSKSNPTPAVFIEQTGDTWSLRVTFELRRDGLPDTAVPLPVADLHAELTSSLLDAPLSFSSLVDEAVLDPLTVRRVVASAPVTDQAQIARVLRDSNARFTVGATVHYREPAPAGETPTGGWTTTVGTIDLGGMSVFHRAKLGTIAPMSVAPMSVAPMAVDVQGAALSDMVASPVFSQRMRFIPRVSDPSPAPTSRTVGVSLAANAAGLSAFYPTESPSDHANRPIYAMVDSVFGVDPDASWIVTGDLPWKTSPIPNQFYVLPASYRIRFDVERGIPAVTVLLLQQPDPTPGSTSTAYRVRVRFEVVPVFDDARLAQLRSVIADAEGIVYPEFTVGGFDGAVFQTSTLLGDLGGKVLTSEDGSTSVDPTGFELVFDGTLEFYTLLAKLLSPQDGVPQGIEGRVRFTLKAAPDDPTPRVVDVPVDLRLDRPAVDVVTAELLPPSPARLWPANWWPPAYARVQTSVGRPVRVGRILPNLLRVPSGPQRVVQDAVEATAAPGSIVIGDPATRTEAPAPPAPPAAPTFPQGVEPDPWTTQDGTARPEVQLLQARLADLEYKVNVTGLLAPETVDAVKAFQADASVASTGIVDAATWAALFPSVVPAAPAAAPGEAILALSPREAIDPRLVTALDVGLADVTMTVDAAQALEKVHQLAASGSLTTQVRVASFQLQHPEGLPPELSGVFGLEIQVRRGAGEPITVYLTRDEPTKSVPLSFTIVDVMAGATPDSPRFDWRRRNMTSGGNGPFSAWESVLGRELFATPVTADTPLSPS